MRGLKQEQWLRIAGVNVDKDNSVREETRVVSSTMRISVQNRHRKSLQTKLENTSEYSVVGQFESCSEEGIDVLPNKF